MSHSSGSRSPLDGSAGSSAESQTIAESFRRGRPEAVDAVRTRVQRIVRFRGLGLSESDRRDIEQEVLAQVWRSVRQDTFDPGAGFWSFLDLVVLRRCVDWRRGRRTEVELLSSMEDTKPGPLQEAIAAERRTLVTKAVAGLGQPCRELLSLRITEEKSFDEIGRILGEEPGTLRVRFHRCIKQVQRDLFRPDGDS